MFRLFAALPVPEEVHDGLIELQKGLEGASWRPSENFHITLRFFGEVDGAIARDLDDELGRIEMPQLELEAAGTDFFGRRDPHSVHARIRGIDEPNQQALTRLARQCEGAARRVGLPPEPRPFKPHITLAYLHHTPVDAVGGYVKRTGHFRSDPFWADRFHLYSSHSAIRGPTRYEAEADYPLGLGN